jgi:DNA replication licensing factor MCM5
MHFLRECQVRNQYIYREQLKSNAQRGKYFLKIDMEHLSAFDDPLVTVFRKNPSEYIRVFEDAVATIYKNDYYDENNLDMDPAPKF